ncbi:MAG: alginate O-acetyltransferase complex protein AlgI [Halieaceae bacterium]|jgi:alginate O-acetyltransferase complex protein AlgI
MVFSTASFLYAFLPAFLLCYTILPWKNAVALIFSLLFFSWGEGVYVVLLLAVIVGNYLLGERVALLRGRSGAALMLGLGVAFNLLVLGYYKYFGFLVSDLLGLDVPASTIVHLPLGISFFIFQSISYLIDVYRGDAEPADSVFDLALYIAMFPQLIAGPIVRYGSVASALRQREVRLADVARGIQLFSLGLAYKMLLANNCAELADSVFAKDPETLRMATAWLGIVAYSLQILFDFAGYSLMAIGLGRLMGFHFPRNFNFPYISRSISEFWRRWHMSLSSWFRDYLYIPLGGNRAGPLKTYRNLFLVFFLCGLWHGAAWTFVAWGLFHGFLLVIERAGLGRKLEQMPAVLSHSYTLLAVMVGWVLFRAESFGHAAGYLTRMFTPGGSEAVVYAAEVSTNENLFMLGVALLMCLPWLEGGRWRSWDDEHSEPLAGGRLAICFDSLMIITLLCLCSVYVASGTYNPFIYFRF